MTREEAVRSFAAMHRTILITVLAALSLAACGDDEQPAAERAGTTELAAYCYASATLDNTGLFNAGSPDEVEHEVAEARVALAEMRDNAPEKVAADVEAVATPFNAVLDELERNEYKPGSADPSAMAAPAVEKASKALKADTPRTCGVDLP
jgi:hypothetical protein